MTHENIKIKSLTVYYTKGRYQEYTDVVALENDKDLGIPRLSIHLEDGTYENINLNHVESWKFELGTVH